MKSVGSAMMDKGQKSLMWNKRMHRVAFAPRAYIYKDNMSQAALYCPSCISGEFLARAQYDTSDNGGPFTVSEDNFKLIRDTFQSRPGIQAFGDAEDELNWIAARLGGERKNGYGEFIGLVNGQPGLGPRRFEWEYFPATFVTGGPNMTNECENCGAKFDERVESQPHYENAQFDEDQF